MKRRSARHRVDLSLQELVFRGACFLEQAVLDVCVVMKPEPLGYRVVRVARRSFAALLSATPLPRCRLGRDAQDGTLR